MNKTNSKLDPLDVKSNKSTLKKPPYHSKKSRLKDNSSSRKTFQLGEMEKHYHSTLNEQNQKRAKKVNEIIKSPRQQITAHPSNITLDYEHYKEQGIKSVKGQLCIEALTKGCIDAFIQLFELSHREPVIVDEISRKTFKLSDKQLFECKEALVNAELARRNGDFEKVYHLYIKLADFFEKEKDFKTSLYFHGKGREIAKQSADTKLEGLAYENIGKAYKRQGNIEQSMKSHESELSLAEAAKNDEEAMRARKHLVDVYTTMGNLLESRDDYRGALINYEKALKTSIQTCDNNLISESYCNMGKIYEKLGEIDKSIDYQKKFEETCTTDREKSKACCALGNLYEKSNNYEEALKMYEKNLEYVQKIEDNRLHGEACDKLGSLLLKMQQFEKAVPYLQKNFELATEANDINWQNSARIKLGYAKGSVQVDDFLKLIKNQNIDALLNWKDNRVLLGNHGKK